MTRKLLAISVIALSAGAAAGETITVAVASNFAPVAEKIAVLYEAGHDEEVVLVRGSTGKLYAQIVNGAPYDVFLAADAARPRRLEDEGFAIPGSRFTYATGQLVIWSRDRRLEGHDCSEALADPAFTVAIANPRLAPYGAAASQYLEQAGLWDDVEPRLVIGENISQTLQFAAAGGAGIGFVAASQLSTPGLPEASCAEPVPAGTHAPIEQQAVLLASARYRPAAETFLAFLGRQDVLALIAMHGYAIPQQASHR